MIWPHGEVLQILIADAPAPRSAIICAELTCHMFLRRSPLCTGPQPLSAQQHKRASLMSTALAEDIKQRRAAVGAPCRGGCRFCGNPELHLVVDLGMSPLCENFLSRDQLLAMEPFYPLRALFCEDCGLMQVEEYVGGREIFDSQ